MGGAAHLYGDAGWMGNPRYASAAPLIVYEADEYSQVHLLHDVPLYDIVNRDPDCLGWLNEPGEFWQVFPDLRARTPDMI
jgi:hypothetical protein